MHLDQRDEEAVKEPPKKLLEQLRSLLRVSRRHPCLQLDAGWGKPSAVRRSEAYEHGMESEGLVSTKSEKAFDT